MKQRETVVNFDSGWLLFNTEQNVALQTFEEVDFIAVTRMYKQNKFAYNLFLKTFWLTLMSPDYGVRLENQIRTVDSLRVYHHSQPL